MKISSISHYRCPVDKSVLHIEGSSSSNLVEEGDLISVSGQRYSIVHGVPYLMDSEALSGIEQQTKNEYDRVADGIYDVAVDWQFAAFREDENNIRESMADLLNIKESDRVLEVGCGTGRDSFRLARRLGKGGSLFMQDLSPGMVHACEINMLRYHKKMRFQCTLEYSVSSATKLPFPDEYFDSVFHFGGFNQFGDLPGSAAELARVTRKDGRVLIGDEAVGPWLKGTEFEGIVTTNNALFKADVPLATLPICARDVSVKWIIGNCFYVIVFTKGDGPPPLDLDLHHKGWRGGTMRTRYFGQLEGVTPEAKDLARKAAAAAGLSEHEWLDVLVKRAAHDILQNQKSSSS